MRNYLILFPVALLSAFILGNSFAFAENHAYTGLPLTEDGWHDLSALVQDNRRIVYVSTSGNDGTGAYYTDQDHADIGGDAFAPTGSVTAYQTLAAGYAEIRDGYADLLLLKRGDVWSESLATWTKSGESKTKPIVLGSYGAFATARPKMIDFGTRYGVSNPEDAFSHMFILGIEFTGTLERQIGGDNFFIEDCSALKEENTGFSIAGFGPDFNNVVIRRCVIAERYPTGATGHVQGLYTKSCIGLLVEENFFDHNGWTAGAEGDPATIHNHNTYLSASNENTVMRNNISTRSSSKGFQAGGGGTVEMNLSVRDAIGIESSRNDADYPNGLASTIQNNVVLDSYDTKLSGQTGWGIRLTNVSSSTVEANIIGLNTDGVNRCGIYVQPADPYKVVDATLKGNIIHNWGRGICIEEVDPLLDNITLQNNKIHDSLFADDEPLVYNLGASAADTTSSGNTFYSTDDAADWASYNGSLVTIASWMSTVGDSTSTTGQTTPSADYHVTDYLTSISETATMTAFYTEIQAQRRGNWDSRYTALPIINFARDKFGLSELPDIDYSFDPTGDVIIGGGSRTLNIGGGAQTLTLNN